MVEYRSFCNADPPQLVSLWHECGLGRGAASGFSTDAFESLNFSQTYFEPEGLVVACDGSRPVGFAHAGFGPNEDRSALDRECGIVCAVMVHPEYRRQGIGRNLIERAQGYLHKSGAKTIIAGPDGRQAPFYVGVYGGTEPDGFLESDPDAAPFLAAVGYEQTARHAIYQRDLPGQGDPISVRLIGLRRKMEIMIDDQTNQLDWWWLTRFGKLESLSFLLVPKGGGEPVAAATVIGLDLYLQEWEERAIGITDLLVKDADRRKGYGQAIVLEICRRLKGELVTRVEAHTPESDEIVLGLLESSGFTRVDTGIVYRRNE